MFSKITRLLGMTKEEIVGIFIILLVISSVSYFNFMVSLRRSRDSQRKSDIRQISDALDKYNTDLGFYPAALDGKISACDGGNDEKGFPIFRPCEWGKEALPGIFDPTIIPLDVHTGDGASYLYLSNSKRFQLFASLEGNDEAEYDPKIVARNLSCGNRICNFGLSSGSTPLDRSIQEYEDEIAPKE